MLEDDECQQGKKRVNQEGLKLPDGKKRLGCNVRQDFRACFIEKVSKDLEEVRKSTT